MNIQDLYDVIYDVVVLDDIPADKETCEYIIEHYDVEKIYNDFNMNLKKFADWVRTFV